MSSINGANGHLVTSSNINSVNLTGAVLVSNETGNIGEYGGYQVKCYHTTGDGCELTRIFLELNNSIPWNRISCEIVVNGTASCWWFNGEVLIL